jgi:putative PEP-CTERM system histidine kinase
MGITAYNEILFAVAGCANAFLLLLLALSPRPSATRAVLAGVCAATAAAAAAMAAGWGGLQLGGAIIYLAGTGSWCAFIFHLLRRQMADKPLTFVMVSAVGALMGAAVLGLSPLIPNLAAFDEHSFPLVGELSARLGLAIYGIVLTENLYRNTASEARWHVSTLCVALGSMFAYNILLYADALLFRRISPLLWSGQAIALTMAVPLLAVAAARNREWEIDIHVSRNVVFHTATLIGSGIFLLALAATGEMLRGANAGWGELAEMTILIAGFVGLVVLLASGSARSYIRRVLADNFYTHRYDYRREWLKSIEVLSVFPGSAAVQTRVIRAVAEIADSPAGVLFVRDAGGVAFQWGGSWNHPAVPSSQPADDAFAALFRGGTWVIELDRAAIRPGWLAEIPQAWLAVPLTQQMEIIGFVILVRPRAPLRLNRETFDVLRIVAQQSAIHLGEQRSARALAEVTQLSDYSRRFAFVVHDMKNVAGQLGMIVQNGRRYRGHQEFHEDVLATVESAFERMNQLLARLRPNSSSMPPGVVVPSDVVRDEVARLQRCRGKLVEINGDTVTAAVAMDETAFRSVIRHLCENAIEVSQGPVILCLRHGPLRVEIDIADDGPGMDAEFVRDKLFQPFGTVKCDGFGIGAYQARELVRAAGGDLVVMSRPNCGTTMHIVLPCLDERSDKTRQVTETGAAE